MLRATNWFLILLSATSRLILPLAFLQLCVMFNSCVIGLQDTKNIHTRGVVILESLLLHYGASRALCYDMF